MKNFLMFLIIFIFAYKIYPIDLTGFGGIRTDDQEKLYGVAIGWEFIPFIQVELEGFRKASKSENFISANPLLSLDLAGITPYLTIGYGFSGEKADVSTYKSFKNYGAGIKFFLGIVGIRIDYRVIKREGENWKRIYGGLDISL